MRDFEEQREEIFNRSKERIRARRQRRKKVIFTCVPLCICLMAGTVWYANSRIMLLGNQAMTDATTDKDVASKGPAGDENSQNDEMLYSSSQAKPEPGNSQTETALANPGAETTGQAFRIVSCKHGEHGFSLEIPAGWEFEKEEYGENGHEYMSISFYPSGKKEWKMVAQYSEAFGVCGTGLTEKKTTFAGHAVIQGFYDGRKNWEFMIFKDMPKYYWAMDGGISLADAKTYEKAIKILQTIQFTEKPKKN